MKNRLLKYIYNFTYKCMKFLMDNNYPIEYDSDYICGEDIFTECYCPHHRHLDDEFYADGSTV
jgi:hypothetical protein